MSRAPSRGVTPADAGVADPFTHPSTAELVRRALAEDVGRGDVTTALTIPAGTSGSAALVTREDCVVAGVPLIDVVLGELHAAGVLRVTRRVAEGAAIEAGTIVADVEGDLGPLLTGERLLLNLIQGLCGVATLTRRYVDAVAGTGVKILDTRKTVPGHRLLQKYAVRMGGGHNHRFGLDDGVLIKDNHIAACGSVRGAVEHARAHAPMALRIEVEVDRLEQIGDALAGGADIILLDNMRPDEIRSARKLVGRRALLEASGGVDLQTVRAIAEAGPDFISVGRLTHSAPAIDLGLDVRARSTASPRTRRAGSR